MVCRQLHNEGSRITGKQFCFLQNNTGADDCCNSQEVCGRSNPGSAAEDGTCYHCNKRKFCTTGNKGCGHNGHLTVSIVLDGSGSHDTRNAASGTDQHRDKGFSGKTKFTEDTVHDECDTGHVSTAFQECQEDKQNQDLRYETKHSTKTSYDTIHDQSMKPSIRNAKCAKQVL